MRHGQLQGKIMEQYKDIILEEFTILDGFGNQWSRLNTSRYLWARINVV